MTNATCTTWADNLPSGFYGLSGDRPKLNKAKKFAKSMDLHDAQLVLGILMLGYGLFLVSPPACFITLGALFLSPFLLSAWRAK